MAFCLRGAKTFEFIATRISVLKPIRPRLSKVAEQKTGSYEMSSANVDILLGMFPNLPKEKALAFLAKASHNLEAAIDQALEYTVQSESQIRVPVNQPPVSFDPPRTPSRTPASPLTSAVTPEARAANAAFNHALEQKLTKIRMNANPANQVQGFEALIREQVRSRA